MQLSRFGIYCWLFGRSSSMAYQLAIVFYFLFFFIIMQVTNAAATTSREKWNQIPQGGPYITELLQL